MLVSHDPPFMFVHIDKAAGSSIQHALRPFASHSGGGRWRRRLGWLGPLNRWGGLHRQVRFSEHARAEDARRCLPPETYAGLFKFAFVRNPWDRLVSRHAFLLRKKDHSQNRLVNALGSFEDYLRWEIQGSKIHSRMRHQHSYVLGPGGESIVDFIGYFERIEKDFAEVSRRIGVPAQLRPVQSSHPRRDYRSSYTPENRELVARAYAQDIALFGYNFDGLG
ncbi:MAG: sulfotransferase family 2 domain-containing protein [Chthoniobacterales bacterium]|nr:sulfotransferase family 2 domain-containing protein [Chthoniobacterales bacterium]